MKIKSLTRVRRVGPQPRHPRERHFPKARGFRASRTGDIRTHTRPAMSGLMAASASFISSALSASPDAHHRCSGLCTTARDRHLRWHTCAKQIPVVDLSLRIALGATSDQAAGLEYVQSTLPFITPTHRYADEYRHEFN